MILLAYLAPLALFAAAIIALAGPGMRPRRTLSVTHGATIIAMVVAAVMAIAALANGPASSTLLGTNGIGLQLRIDALSVIMTLLVSFIGWIVVRYSRAYMDGDARQGAFMAGLCVTLGFVLVLVMAGNIGQLVLGWIGTSLSLHRLLLFYGDRPAARLAARKMFLFARLGDVFLITAAVLLVQGFGTGDIAAITADIRAGNVPAGSGWAAFCLGMTVLLKSAQFPTHGWLTEVMDAPTPVSALLHAGVINAGGFLVIRFADLFLTAAPAMHLLAIVGGLTAAVASLVMLLQPAVKLGLAWSTVAQMGFMLLQCGLGAFGAALLHIVAHSLYKAHAFLGAGAVVDQARAKLGHRLAPTRAADVIPALAVAALSVVAMGWVFGVTLDSKPALVVLGLILVMGLAHLMVLALGQGRALALRMAAATLALSAVYFTLQLVAETLTAGAIPATATVTLGTALIMVLMLVVFAATALVQVLAPAKLAKGEWRGMATHLRHGFYITNKINKTLAPRLAA